MSNRLRHDVKKHDPALLVPVQLEKDYTYHMLALVKIFDKMAKTANMGK